LATSQPLALKHRAGEPPPAPAAAPRLEPPRVSPAVSPRSSRQAARPSEFTPVFNSVSEGEGALLEDGLRPGARAHPHQAGAAVQAAPPATPGAAPQGPNASAAGSGRAVVRAVCRGPSAPAWSLTAPGARARGAPAHSEQAGSCSCTQAAAVPGQHAAAASRTHSFADTASARAPAAALGSSFTSGTQRTSHVPPALEQCVMFHDLGEYAMKGVASPQAVVGLQLQGLQGRKHPPALGQGKSVCVRQGNGLVETIAIILSK
jgi:hypothetical protein